MSYGLQYINTFGEEIFDETYFNFALYSSGTVANGGTITVPATHKVFVRPNTDGAWIECQVTSTLIVGSRTSYTVLISSGSADYAVFAPYNLCPHPNPTYGLRVYNTSGVLSYDSDTELLQIESSTRYEYTQSTLFATFDTLICSGALFNPYVITDKTVTQSFSASTKRRFVSLSESLDIIYETPSPKNSACTSSITHVAPLRYRFTNNNTLQLTPSAGQFITQYSSFSAGGFITGLNLEIALR